MAFTVLLSVLVAGCGIKWATNKVLSNPDAINKVGAVYDKLNPKDTTEKLFFIPGDSVIIELTDTAYLNKTDTLRSTDTIRITNTRIIRRTDTVKHQLPPDNREIKRLSTSLANNKAITASLEGQLINYKQQTKTAENRLIWMAAGVLVLGLVIGVLIRFKVKL